MGCTHDCSSCSESCGSKKPESLLAELNKASKVKRVIAIASGKGGVGKSTVTSLLAVAAAKRGLRAGVLDADVTGPSIPKAFGVGGSTYQNEDGILPSRSETGVELMSLNLLVENPSDPVVWRGPVIAGAVKQFWTDVAWGELDVMFVDMPPGTGDVPLTVFQSLPVDGVVVVTTPQQLVEMIVEKSVRMAEMLKKPVLGLVENMGSFTCPDCGRRHALFGETRVAELAARHGIPSTVALPIDPELVKAMDLGRIEHYGTADVEPLLDAVL